MTGLLLKSFGESYGSTALTAACYWPPLYSVQKFAICIRAGSGSIRGLIQGADLGEEVPLATVGAH